MPKFYSNLSVALRYPVRLGSMYPNIQESSALCVLEPFGFIVITLKNLFGLSRCRKKKCTSSFLSILHVWNSVVQVHKKYFAPLFRFSKIIATWGQQQRLSSLKSEILSKFWVSYRKFLATLIDLSYFCLPSVSKEINYSRQNNVSRYKKVGSNKNL